MQFFTGNRLPSRPIGEAANIRLAFVAAILLGLFAASDLVAAAVPPAPKFEGNSLPEPPAQRHAWNVPSERTLPPEFLVAAEELFKAGLADPRECQYRQVTFVAGGGWSRDNGVGDFHAWVLPVNEPRGASPNAAAPRFAVAWNGLVYPLIRIGAKVDLRLDVEAACKADEEDRAKWEKDFPKQKFSHAYNSFEDQDTASEKTLSPIKAYLLARLGETALAGRVWKDWLGGSGTDRASADETDPFMVPAELWLQTRFARCITAHMRGDDHLALLDARALTDAKKTVVEIAAKCGFQADDNSDGGNDYFGFLKLLPVFLADQERRAREKPTDSLSAIVWAKYPSSAARVAAIINALDQVNENTTTSDGNVEFVFFEEGVAAVEPLLECLAHDDRLARSINVNSDDSVAAWTPVAVRQIAYEVLQIMFRRSFLPPDSSVHDLGGPDAEMRRALIERIKAHWKNYKGQSPEDQWFVLLDDDSASARDWANAAEWITRPGSPPPGSGGGPLFYNPGVGVLIGHEPGDGMRLQGERLRNRNNPSVSDLLVKRLAAISKLQGDSWNANLDQAAIVATALSDWDGRKHLAELREFSEVLRKSENHSDSLGSLYLERMELHDDRAFVEYAKWISATGRPIGRYSGAPEFAFEPM